MLEIKHSKESEATIPLSEYVDMKEKMFVKIVD